MKSYLLTYGRPANPANVYISAIFWGGKPLKIVDLARNGHILIFTSSEIQVKPLQKISAIEADPDDDKFIECAVAAKAGYIVSGDKHLLNLKNYQGIQIMKAANFLEIFE